MEPSPFLLEIAPESIDVIGNQPNSFKRYRKALANNNTQILNSQNAELAEKWHKSVRVYHDDYGYGAILNAKETEGEFVITVQFETGAVKHFMPEYQAHSLMICKE